MNFIPKKRKPNWSERELTVLAKATTRIKLLKAKFSPMLTSERKQELWKDIAEEADIQSLTKNKGERRRSMSKTGGGPAPEFHFKEWEKVVLQSLSDIAIEGIACGVYTAECVNQPSSATHTPSGLVVYEVPEAELSQTAATPSTSWDEPLTQSEIHNTNTGCLSVENAQDMDAERQADGVNMFFNLEKEKMASVERSRERKLEIMEEMLALQRRSTLALEQINHSLKHGNSQPQSFSLSPVIKFS